MKKYILLLKEEFDEDWKWYIQMFSDDLEEIRENKQEMLSCNGVEDAKIFELKEII